MITIIISAIISAITAKIVATYYFEKADGYVKEMCEMTEKNNKETITILRKLQEGLLLDKNQLQNTFFP